MQPALALDPTIALPNGATVALEGAHAVACDADGRPILRFDGRTVELVATADLTISAPHGSVTIRSRDDVVIEARDIRQRARRALSSSVDETALELDGSSLTARAAQLGCRSDEASLTTDRATVLAQRLTTTAQHAIEEVERLEVRAGKIVERVGDVARHASGLCQLTARRLHTLVLERYALTSERTSLRSREETTIDGKKILLG